MVCQPGEDYLNEEGDTEFTVNKDELIDAGWRPMYCDNCNKYLGAKEADDEDDHLCPGCLGKIVSVQIKESDEQRERDKTGSSDLGELISGSGEFVEML